MGDDLFLARQMTAADVRAAVRGVNSHLEEACRLAWELKQHDNWKQIGNYETWTQFCEGEFKRPRWEVNREIVEYDQKRIAASHGMKIGNYAQAAALATIEDEQLRMDVLREATRTQPENKHTGRPYKDGPPATHIKAIAQQYVVPSVETRTSSVEKPLTTAVRSDRMHRIETEGVDEYEESAIQDDDVIFSRVTGTEYHTGATTVFVNHAVKCPHCMTALKLESPLLLSALPHELYVKLLR